MTTRRTAFVVLALSIAITAALAAAPRAPQAAVTATTESRRAAPLAMVEVPLAGAAAEERFRSLGFDVVSERPGQWARILAWPADLERLARAGFESTVLDADYGRTLARAAGITAKPAPRDRDRVDAVPPFGSGSLAGFYTLSEVNAWLDSIAANDAHGIVSSVVQIGTSRQGRPIRAVRIGNETAPDHSRPRVLLTGLTHAREPGGMQNIIWFVDRLLAGYGSDPNLTYLVDQREMWFVPVVNPDGYAVNEAEYFDLGSFGLWRKNVRDNNNNLILDDQDGVDLNRNFGFQWGFDNSGSSPTASSQTYRGPASFSEPETQALRDFCVLHGFRTANNFHTYHETTLYPWAYSGTISPDGNFCIRMADDMMRDAHYSYGISVQILYPVNGDANDWMYGEQVTKPKVLAVTTEAGGQNDGFWPSAARILPIAAQNFRSCMVLSYVAGTYVHVSGATLVSSDGWLHPHGDAEVALTLRNDGLDATTGAVTVTASTGTPGITVTDAVSTFAAIASTGVATPSANDRIGLHAASNVPSGTVVPLYLEIRDQASYVLLDTTTVTVGQPVTVFADAGSGGLANWTSVGGWGIQNVSGNPLFTDSPAGDYAGSANTRLTLNPALNLTGGNKAYLKFDTQWAIEGGFDFGRVEVSTNGGTTWTPVAGRLTRPGHGTTGGYSGGTQTLGQPGYDMTKRFMVPETIDLSAYAGLSNLRLRFRLTSDNGFEDDGWWIDNIQVLVYPTDVTDVQSEGGSEPQVALATAGANPFRDRALLVATFRAPTRFQAAVYAVDGSLVRVLGFGIAAAGRHEIVWDGTDASGKAAASGTYFVRLDSAAGNVTRRLVRLR